MNLSFCKTLIFQRTEMRRVSKAYVKNQPTWSIGTLCLSLRLSLLSFLLLHFSAYCFLSTWKSDGEAFSALLSWGSGTSFQPVPQRTTRASCSSFDPSIKPKQMHCHLSATYLIKATKVPQGTSVLLPFNWSLLSENYSSVPHSNGGLQSNQRGCN